MNANFSQFGAILLAALLVFAVYRRLRRSFGQQPLRPLRMQLRILLLLIVGCLLLPSAMQSAAFLFAVLAGAAAGVALALWGAAHTRFLRLADRLYYVPHTYTGIAVSLLFVGRLAYRLIQVYGSADQSFTAATMLRSPLTVGIYFVLMGYYVCYYSVVLWRSKQAAAAGFDQPARPLPDESTRA
ncbi:MAG: hypothetical protein ACLPV8_14370 [Steroidobacteraceae bacterium]